LRETKKNLKKRIKCTVGVKEDYRILTCLPKKGLTKKLITEEAEKRGKKKRGSDGTT